MNHTPQSLRALRLRAVEELREAEARDLAIRAAWQRGHLNYKLCPYQKDIRKKFRASKARKFVLKCSRRIGKSYWLVVSALEEAFANPNRRILYVAATSKDVEQIIKPLFEEICQDCPEDLRPDFKWHAGEIRVPSTNSIIRIGGCDDEKKAKSLRGTSEHLIIIDEAGFITELEGAVTGVLLPMTLTTKGRMLIASSPAKVIGHYFSKICEQAYLDGALIILTIWDAIRLGVPVVGGVPTITKEDAAAICEESGGAESTHWRREYLVEDVTDSSVQVIPSWNAAAEAEIVKAVAPPAPYLDRYTSLDFGFKDGAGTLFGYWDGAAAMLCIQDELLLFQKNTGVLAQSIKDKETALWQTLGTTPYLRIADNNIQSVSDLQEMHGLTFYATEKDNKELQCNNLDLLIQQRKIRVDPRCKMLITHLRTTIWNSGRTKYQRNEFGHGDLLDALVYLVRNMHRHRVTGPAIVLPSDATHFVPAAMRERHALSQAAQSFKDHFFGGD